jgi:putative endonuclease
MLNYYVYVLKNQAGMLYIGSTTDLETRVRRHQEGKAGWTRPRGPWELVEFETFETRSEAMRREKHLKTGKANQELRQRLVRVNTSDRKS